MDLFFAAINLLLLFAVALAFVIIVASLRLMKDLIKEKKELEKKKKEEQEKNK